VTGDRKSKIETRKSKFETRVRGCAGGGRNARPEPIGGEPRRLGDFRVSIFEFRFSSFQFPVSSFRFRISHGFTLLEMMVVLTLILIVASMAVPTYHIAVVHAREAVLRDDLYTLRKLIDQYTIDKQQPPESLDDLVDAGYLRGGLPTDPFTGRNDTWQAVTEEVPSGGDTVNGITDVHSGSDETALDGTTYDTW
jgi:general secretion pathway protein G